MPETARIGSAASPPLLVRVAVPGTALAGAAGLVLAGLAAQAAFPVFVAGTLAALGAVVYVFSPLVGAWVLLAVGAVSVASAVVALATVGSVPWLLVAFWGASATLLAGLMHLIEQGSTAEMLSGVTVATVVAVLVLSALGLGQYVRMSWSEGERAVLESLPMAARSAPGEPDTMVMDSLEPAPGGKWAANWVYRGSDASAAWSEMLARVRAHGWKTLDEAAGECTAVKDGYRLHIVAEPLGPVAPGPSRYDAEPVERASMTAFVWAEGGTTP